MVELVEYIVKKFANEPEKVFIELEESDDKNIIKVNVSPDDMGKVIGKQGRIAKAIRTIVKAVATKEGKKYVVEIVDKN